MTLFVAKIQNHCKDFRFYIQYVFEHESHESDELLFVLFVFESNNLRLPYIIKYQTPKP